MIARFLRWLSSKLERREICAEDGKLYLERFKLFGWMPGSKRRYPFSVYLHRFHLPDQDDAPHSHPWKWAFSIVLSGSYIEGRSYRLSTGEVLPSPQEDWMPVFRLVRWLNWLGADSFHRIRSLHGEVWTLFVVGPKSGSWGFAVDGKVIPWRERLEQRGIKADL